MNWKKFSFSRAHRIEAYLERVNLSSSFLEKEEITQLHTEIEQLLTKVKRLQTMQIFFYFAIYFALISYLFSYLGIFQELLSLLSSFFAFAGTTIFILLAFVNHKIIEANYQDLHLRVSHLLSLQVKFLKTSQSIFKQEENSYTSFLEYFSKKE